MEDTLYLRSAQLLPSLLKPLSELFSLLCSPFPPPLIYVHCPSNQELACHLIQSILEQRQQLDAYDSDWQHETKIEGPQTMVLLDLVQLYHPKMVYEVIYEALASSSSNLRPTLPREGAISLSAFLDSLDSVCRVQGMSGESDPRFLMFTHAERMQEVGKEVDTGLAGQGWMAGILRASEMVSSIQVCQILISHLSWTQIRPYGTIGGLDPINIEFAGLAPNDALDLLAHEAPLGAPLTMESEINLYRSLLDVVQQSFATHLGLVDPEIAELRALGEEYWPIWKNLVTSGRAAPFDIAKLTVFLKPFLMSGTERFGSMRYFRGPNSSTMIRPESDNEANTDIMIPQHHEMPTLEHVKLSVVPKICVNDCPPVQELPSISSSIPSSLPLLSRYLLLGSYYASYNPPRTDVNIFVKLDNDGGRKRKKTRAKRPNAKSDGDLKRQRKEPQNLLGPRAFPTERLLALFEAILPEALIDSAKTTSIGSQLNFLIGLRLIIPAATGISSNSGGLNAPAVFPSISGRLSESGTKLKCNIAWEQALELAFSVGWKETDMREKVWTQE